MKLAGFALTGDKFTVNSGAFNTYAINGHCYNGFKDESKSMNKLESQLVVGAFVASFMKGWPVMRTDFLSVDECMSVGKHFMRQETSLDENGKEKGHATVFYRGVYGPYTW
jgi:hypothetical protein